jgi:hypothetical protein
MKQKECNVCFEMKEIYNNCCTFNTCNACLFLIDGKKCLQCQKPVSVTKPEPKSKTEFSDDAFMIFFISNRKNLFKIDK